MTIDKVFDWFANSYGWQDTIPVNCQRGHDKLLIITGENATGKSLLRRLLQQLARQDKIEAISVSPEYRQMGGIATAMVFGDESYEASGQIACKVVMGSIKTSKSREKPHIVILDEPDAGLSDSAAAGVGEEIAEYMQAPSDLLRLYCVITHRKAMLTPFAAMDASHIRVGDSLSLADVVAQPVVPVRPSVVRERAHVMFQKVQELLQGNK